jgi:hypothetical protein
MASRFDTLLRRVGVPLMERWFGVPAVYTDTDGESRAVTAMFSRRQEPVGEYSERSESRWRVEVSASAVPQPRIGATFTVAPGVLDDLLGAVTLDDTVFTVRGIDSQTGGDGFTWSLLLTLDTLETDG